MENLTIGFDAKRAMRNSTGLGNYSRLVIDVLSRAYPSNSYRLYSPGAKAIDRVLPLLSCPGVRLVTPRTLLGRMCPALWRVYGGLTDQLRHDRVSLFHGLSNELPLDIGRARIPSVVTIHDLIFLRFPDGYKPVDRAIYDYKFRNAARNATRVIAISERTRLDLIELYGIPEQKIDVVYQGCHSQFLNPVSPELMHQVARQYSLPQRFVVMVGTVEPRKNQMLAVRALPLLPADVKLVIVGRGRQPYSSSLDRLVSSLHLSSRVIRIPSIPFEHLPAVYSLASVAAYPSFYEGFGIPVIEALGCGVPVVAATGSCLEEAGGPGAVYVDPRSVEQFAFQVNRLLDDSDARAAMVRDGRTHIRRFDASGFARSIMQVYRRAIGSF